MKRGGSHRAAQPGADAQSGVAAPARPHPVWTLAACAALLLLVATAFQPALRGGFLDWDDAQNFADNLRWRGLSGDHLHWMARTLHMGHWQPLTWLTLGLDHELFGLDPGAMHAVSIAWHAATTIAVLDLARCLLRHAAPGWSAGRNLAGAATAAALFALHPLRCESVCWLTERRDVVSGIFFVAALQAWVRYAESGRRAHYALAFAAQVACLLAKAWGIVLPASFLVLDLALSRRARGTPWRTLLAEKLPFAAASIAVAAVNLRAHATATDAQATWEEHGPWTRALQAGYAVLFYPAKTLAPLDLSPHYELPPAAELATPAFALAFLGAIVVTVLAFRARRRPPWFAWSWAAYLVVLAPVSGFTQAGPQLVADRYSYLSCLPFAFLVAAAIVHPRVPRTLSIAAVTLCVSALLVATRAQSRVWIDSRSLWQRALEHDPESGVANSHTAGVLLREADATTDSAAKRALVERAAQHFARAYQRSGNPAHIVNAGGVLRLRAELEPERKPELVASALFAVEAGIAAGEAAGVADPKWRRTRAALLLDLERWEEARAALAECVAALPDDVVSRVLLARALEALGRPAEAVPHREHAARLRPAEPESWIALGETLVRAGEASRAIEPLERGLAAASQRGDLVLVERARSALRALGR